MGVTRRTALLFCLEWLETQTRLFSWEFTKLEPRPKCEGAWELCRDVENEVRSMLRELVAKEKPARKGAIPYEAEHMGHVGHGGQADGGEPQREPLEGTPGIHGNGGGLVPGKNVQDRIPDLAVGKQQDGISKQVSMYDRR